MASGSWSAFLLGSAIGVPLAYLMPMTAVPQRTALSHAFGALAAALVGTAEFYRETPHGFVMVALVVETLLGFLTFTASLMAFGKLQEIAAARGPSRIKDQNVVNLGLFAVAVEHGRAADLRPHRHLDVPGLLRPGAAVRRAADHPDRRRGHAHRDRAAQFLRRPFGLRHGIRAGQQAADHRRRAGRLLRLDPFDHHVQGDEPLVHQRAVRRVRTDCRRAPRASEKRPVRQRDARRRRPRFWKRRAA